MAAFTLGFAHAPITPFTPDLKIDWGLFERIIEFHLANGAQSLALPMHTGESVSLSDIEQREVIDFTVKQVKGRVPVIAHVSDAGTRIAAVRARYMEEAGAAAIVATTPYHWTPPPAMILEHLGTIGAAVKLPFYVFYTPSELGATKLTPDLIVKLMDRLPNFAGLVDASLEWQFMIDTASAAWAVRPEFQLVSGTEYMVSAGAIGASAMFSALAAVAPRHVRKLYDICRTEKYFDARQVQKDIAALRQAVKRAGHGGLKGALRVMGRACGQPRPPLDALSEAGYAKLADEIRGLAFLKEESRGW